MSGFTITPITANLLDPVFDLATRVFAASSNLHRALNVDMTRYRRALRPCFEAMVAQHHSLTALSPDGQVLGCLIATHLEEAFIAPQDTLAPYPQISALTGQLLQTYRTDRPSGVNHTLLVDMAATHPDARHLGLYSALRAHIETQARTAGLTFIMGALSSAITQHVVLSRMGHRKVAEIRFAEFEWNGTRPFQSITSPPSIVLAEGTL